MNPSPHQSYLETEVMAASPQRLRLKLIEGALRFARRAEQLWEGPTHGEASMELARCIAVVIELRAAIQRDHSEMARTMADVYGFVLRELLTVRQRQDVSALPGVMRVLEIDRETWHALCQAWTEPVTQRPAGQVTEITARQAAAMVPPPVMTSAPDASPGSRLCLDA